MNVREVRRLLRIQVPAAGRTRRVLMSCHSTSDFRVAARRRLPRAVFDYLDGGADDEISLAENRAAFARWSFHPDVLRDVARVDMSTEIFGRRLAAPLGLAPTGYTRMVHPAGELAVAAGSSRAALPYVLSTVGTTSIEELAATGHPELWFQLYVLRDRGLTRSLVERASSSGYRALEISVDTAVAGRRLRDVRNGFTIPPCLTPRTVIDIARHPRYWTEMLRGPALEFANLGIHDIAGAAASIENVSEMFDPSLTWDDVGAIRDWWKGPLLLKGPLRPEDARRAIHSGVDGVHQSNHGGRQLDRSVAPIELVRPVRDAIGDRAVIVVDSGIRGGPDIVVALARGADLCMIGRAYLYGLASAGRQGVQRVLELLMDEVRRSMQLLGISTLAELGSRADELVRRSPGVVQTSLPRRGATA